MKTHLRNLSLLWLRWTLGIVVLLESIHFTFLGGHGEPFNLYERGMDMRRSRRD
jgi:hypothetical protein